MLYIFCFISEITASQNYLIPSYYGSREQDFLLRKSILQGNLSSFYWYPSITKNEKDEKYYMAYKNAIFEIDSSKISFDQENRSRIIAGNFNDDGSYRDGDAASSRFNNIKSLIYFSKNETEAQKEYTKTTIIIQNNGTSCLQVDQTNYTQCVDSTSDPIDPYRIKDIYTERTILSQETTEFLYVVDSGNHCIRKIDLQKKITSTFAGICGQKGFKDGMLGVNQFSNPDQMGLDVLGNIFVNDFDNHFIRIISPDGYVKTLISGSCRQDVRYNDLELGSLKLKRVICLKNWIKTSGQPSTHLVVQNYNICTQHITDCQ